MSRHEYEYLSIIKETIRFNKRELNWSNRDVVFWLEGIIFASSPDCSEEWIDKITNLRNRYVYMEE